MKRNVLTWNQALEKGFEPSLYPYNETDIPEGNYKARLDCKIWAKKTMGVSCYYTFIEINKKCCITVFRDKMEAYKIQNSSIDFAECPIGRLYSIEMSYNKNKKMFLKNISFIEI